MTTYTTLAGRVIELPELPSDVSAYLDKVRAATADSAITPAELTALIYSLDNPILDHQFVPGRAYVTGATLADPVTGPVYRVLSDLLGRKEMQARGTTEDEVFAPYTIDVPTAAGQLGVTQQAVRAAIDDWRLSAVFRGGQWWLRPEAIASFKLSKRGRPAKGKAPRGTVSVRVGGTTEKGSLSIRVEGAKLKVIEKEGGARVGYLPIQWTRAIVKTTSDTGVRAFEIEPKQGGGSTQISHLIDQEMIEHAHMYVRGLFRVVKKHNKTQDAIAAWKAFGKTAAK